MDIESITNFLNQYGLIAVFILITLEYACFPLPSEIVLPVSGIVATAGGINIFIVLIVSLVAGIIGSSICYFIGYLGGTALTDKIFRRHPNILKGLKKTQEWQMKYGVYSVMIGRVLPLFRTYISFVSGFARQKYLSFILFSSIGIMVWNTVLIMCGYLLGERYEEILPFISDYSVVIAVVLIFVILIFIGYKFLKLKKRQNNKDN